MFMSFVTLTFFLLFQVLFVCSCEFEILPSVTSLLQDTLLPYFQDSVLQVSLFQDAIWCHLLTPGLHTFLLQAAVQCTALL